MVDGDFQYQYVDVRAEEKDTTKAGAGREILCRFVDQQHIGTAIPIFAGKCLTVALKTGVFFCATVCLFISPLMANRNAHGCLLNAQNTTQ